MKSGSVPVPSYDECEMTALGNENKKIITDAIDQVMDKYVVDNKIIFSSEAERSKYHFGAISKKLKDWKKSKECMVPGCSQRSIKRSHAIPRGMSLASISENGHLLTPEFDQKIGVMALKPIGLSVASTFPGFCSEHERLFEGFESHKKLATEAHVYLQTYRAACRELFRSSFVIRHLEWLVSSYCRLRDERLMKLVGEKVIESGFSSDAKFTSLSVSNDPSIDWANDWISSVRELSSHIRDRVLPALEYAIFNGRDDDIFVSALNIDIEVPVALSGCAPFFVNDNNVKKQVNVLMNVVPCADHTLLIFAGDIANRAYIEFYISKWTANVFSTLSMVESWMVNGTDQWYLKPSVWDRITESRRTAILKAICECDQNIGEEYGLSIFDNIRSTLLLKLEEKEESTQDDAYYRFVESQKKKYNS